MLSSLVWLRTAAKQGTRTPSVIARYPPREVPGRPEFLAANRLDRCGFIEVDEAAGTDIAAAATHGGSELSDHSSRCAWVDRIQGVGEVAGVASVR